MKLYIRNYNKMDTIRRSGKMPDYSEIIFASYSQDFYFDKNILAREALMHIYRETP